LPNRSRVAETSALIGFHSAIGSRMPGRVSVGTNAFDTNVSGKITRKPSCWATSTVFTSSPRRTPIHDIVNVKSSISTIASTNSPTVPCTRQPTTRPDSISTTRMTLL